MKLGVTLNIFGKLRSHTKLKSSSGSWKAVLFLPKITWLKGSGWETHLATFALKKKTSVTCFFCCPAVKIIWGILGQVLGANNVPSGSEQYKCWIKNWLPNGAPVYTLGLAAFCWAIWKRRNKACFEKKMLTNPLEILSHACALVSYWAGLCGADMQATILAGVKTLLSCAHRVLAQTSSPSPRSWGGSLKSTGFPPARPWTSLAALVEFLLLVYVASVSPSWDELSF